MKEKSHRCGKWTPSSTYTFVRVEKGDHKRARFSTKRRARAAIDAIREYLRRHERR